MRSSATTERRRSDALLGLVAMVSLLALGCGLMPITSSGSHERFSFGRLADGREVLATRLTNARGYSVTVLDWGGIVQSLRVPLGRDGGADVVLGFDDLEGYLEGPRYLGSTIGRFANRIGAARFQLDGEWVEVDANEGANQLHGGPEGFDRRLFAAKTGSREGAPYVELSLTSPAGDQGYPGNLQLAVRYLLEADELRIETRATSDAVTLFSPTHHGYFNLAGSGDVRGHRLRVHADAYTPTNDALIPTGEKRLVEGTPLDFREAKVLGEVVVHPNLSATRGFDHNLILRGEGLRTVARLEDPVSGRWMEVVTDRPGLQLYSANAFDGSLVGKQGKAYARHAGVCLETQVWPDAPNHPDFPSAVLRPGQEFRSTTALRFGSEERSGP